jgi:hypothetical protein
MVKIAKKARTSLSKSIVGTVDAVIDEDEDFKPRRELMREMETRRAEIKTLHDYLCQRIIVLQKDENELKRYVSKCSYERINRA